MTLHEVLDYLRARGHEVGLMANRGDPDAIKFRDVYYALHRDQLNIQLQNELLVVAESYIGANLTMTERTVKNQRYGYEI